ncbi:MAG TPA: pitrilysin family protein [Bryobacteraceae bacterium]|jgi:zinc protease|nr:pitrilysin family protein [Bryobacteraceae bacterium]
MRFRLLALILLLCMVLPGAETTNKKIFPLPYDQHDFPNGLRLVTVPTSYPNVVALYIVVRTGSRNEIEPGKSGFAHLFEHMMFRGTKQFPTEKYEATMREAGAASNAFTSDDLTAYHTTFSKEDLETMLRVEADRFQSLEYSPDVFKTETLAVLGEYNKNSASPMSKLNETMRNTAFDKHTYKHTTMGFLEDVKNMPHLFDYSREFFNRYYKPEYTTLLVVGDVTPQQTKALVEKYWGGWKRGNYKPEIPVEPKQTEARTAHVNWPSPTLPWVYVGFKSAPYSDSAKDSAALDLISFLGFSESSDLYQRLVIQQQKTDAFGASNPDHVDPYLFTVVARVKKEADMKDVEDQILATLATFKDTLVSQEKLNTVKQHLRYSFALGMNNSEAIAGNLAHYIALGGTPETLNRLYEVYDKLTPEDLREVARKYFTAENRTIVTLTGASAVKKSN